MLILLAICSLGQMFLLDLDVQLPVQLFLLPWGAVELSIQEHNVFAV